MSIPGVARLSSVVCVQGVVRKMRRRCMCKSGEPSWPSDVFSRYRMAPPCMAWRGQVEKPGFNHYIIAPFYDIYYILVINLICPLHLLLFVPRCLHLLYMGRFHCVKEEAIRQLHVDYSLFNIFSNYIKY